MNRRKLLGMVGALVAAPFLVKAKQLAATECISRELHPSFFIWDDPGYDPLKNWNYFAIAAIGRQVSQTKARPIVVQARFAAGLV